MARYPTPSDLVEALNRGEPEALSRLDQLVHPPVSRLVGRLIERHHIGHDREILVNRTLHWLRMYLRSLDPSDFAMMSPDAFRARLLAAAFRVLTPPALTGGGIRVWFRKLLGRIPGVMYPSPAPRSIEQVFGAHRIWNEWLPHDQVGGDWSRIDVAGDGALWVIVADVTGHGYPAYIVADGLRLLWGTRRCDQLRSQDCAPRALIDELDREVEPVLPDGIFIEATVARFATSGLATLSGAGLCRVVLRRSGHDGIRIHRLGGLLLGLGPNNRDEVEWKLQSGDEVTMGSDGLFEQPVGDRSRDRLEASLEQRVGQRLGTCRNLHQAIVDVMRETLRASAQWDDITIVSVCFNGETPSGRGGTHAPV
jgi:hypothetical protein